MQVCGVPSRRASRRSRRSRLRGAGAVRVQCVPVRDLLPPRLGLASFYGAVARSHPCPYPVPPGSCLRTHEEALETCEGMRYHECGRNAGASSHPCERPCRRLQSPTGKRIMPVRFDCCKQRNSATFPEGGRKAVFLHWMPPFSLLFHVTISDRFRLVDT